MNQELLDKIAQTLYSTKETQRNSYDMGRYVVESNIEGDIIECGVVIIDDWALDGVRTACYEFFEEKGITPIIHTIENSTPTYFFK
jgi:hypothetical protein